MIVMLKNTCSFFDLTSSWCFDRLRMLVVAPPVSSVVLYSKTGVYKGIHFFSYFCPKT